MKKVFKISVQREESKVEQIKEKTVYQNPYGSISWIRPKESEVPQQWDSQIEYQKAIGEQMEKMYRDGARLELLNVIGTNKPIVVDKRTAIGYTKEAKYVNSDLDIDPNFEEI